MSTPLEYAQNIYDILRDVDGTTASTALAIAKELVIYRTICEGLGSANREDLSLVSRQPI